MYQAQNQAFFNSERYDIQKHNNKCLFSCLDIIGGFNSLHTLMNPDEQCCEELQYKAVSQSQKSVLKTQ